MRSNTPMIRLFRTNWPLTKPTPDHGLDCSALELPSRLCNFGLGHTGVRSIGSDHKAIWVCDSTYKNSKKVVETKHQLFDVLSPQRSYNFCIVFGYPKQVMKKLATILQQMLPRSFFIPLARFWLHPNFLLITWMHSAVVWAGKLSSIRIIYGSQVILRYFEVSSINYAVLPYFLIPVLRPALTEILKCNMGEAI